MMRTTRAAWAVIMSRWNVTIVMAVFYRGLRLLCRTRRKGAQRRASESEKPPGIEHGGNNQCNYRFRLMRITQVSSLPLTMMHYGKLQIY
jgi:hypothetical protein